LSSVEIIILLDMLRVILETIFAASLFTRATIVHLVSIIFPKWAWLTSGHVTI